MKNKLHKLAAFAAVFIWLCAACIVAGRVSYWLAFLVLAIIAGVMFLVSKALTNEVR
jgi:hypothetical protein